MIWELIVTEEHDRAWVIHRHVVREHGVALAGPDPRTLDAYVSPGVRQSVLPVVRVLTMCRMHYTLQYGVVVSKPLAARWAQATLDERWTPLIQAALAWSSDIAPDLFETLRFIDDTRKASEP